jgi:hypothetical protein
MEVVKQPRTFIGVETFCEETAFLWKNPKIRSNKLESIPFKTKVRSVNGLMGLNMKPEFRKDIAWCLVPGA